MYLSRSDLSIYCNINLVYQNLIGEISWLN
nr:MAG TPA: hypothetical protein [Caudoviricetes sp.]DAU06605.1 MAG TPA: hypothetical protein [Caudoviricetes sp.]DAW54279.1 MAG TPA: hypothetical protein [Caudoviricetes sp.]DAY34247.1 MAG TPA: hypothetical protein [Caudoviricetes sp.]